MAWNKTFFFAFICVAGLVVPGALHAQQIRGALERLQKQPMTLFDAGMKSLRRQALDTADRLSAQSGMDVTASVVFLSSDPAIKISFAFKTPKVNRSDELALLCPQVRRDAILKMFRVGLANYQTNLSVSERIRRRIGGQFAPEPISSLSETIALGEQIGQMTYFEVSLVSTENPDIKASCQALATDSLIVSKRGDLP